MKFERILVGTVDEIADYCVAHSEAARELGGKNLLYTREGFISQITGQAFDGDKNSPIRPPDMGMVFYLTRKDPPVEGEETLELKSMYYRIMEPLKKEE